ncbi:MAG: carboxypeptidase regulatory-like domain-containing protein [Anaerolineae bacterium]
MFYRNSLNKRAIISFSILFLLLLFAVSGQTLLASTRTDDEPIEPVKIGEKIVAGHVFIDGTDLEVDAAVRELDRKPVANAQVIAFRVDKRRVVQTKTNEEGAYRLVLSPGLWSITVRPTDESVPADWVYPRDAQDVKFEENDVNEKQEVNFIVVPTSGVVFGEIVLPNGEAPDFAVVIALRNGEGIGREYVTSPEDGSFEIHLPPGRYDLLIHPKSDRFVGPNLDPIFLRPGQELDLGKIMLIPLSASVSGQVVDDAGNGVKGVPVTAWHRGRTAVIKTETNEAGEYILHLATGGWHIQPAPGPNVPYLYLGEGENVKLESEQELKDVDFQVLSANSTIKGELVDGNGEVVDDIEGWATAVNIDNHRIKAGGPVRAGLFNIHVPRGKYVISVELAPGTPYVVTERGEVAVEAGETAEVSIVVREKQEMIVGALIDPRQSDAPVIGVRGKVGAWMGDRWATTHIDPETGTYKLPVSEGIWQVDYKIDPENYVKLGGAQNIPVPVNQTVRVPLPVTEKDAGIKGTVFDPDGNPLPGAIVIFDGLTGPVKNLWLHTRTDDNGNYRFALPYGRYRVGAVAGNENWINPVDLLVNIEPNSVEEDADLHFHEPNAKVVGRLAIPDAPGSGDVLIFGWTERGGFNWITAEVELDDDGTARGDYSLPIVAGTVWHVGAIFENEDAYWTNEGTIKVGEDQEIAVLNLELNGPRVKPSPAVVVFDAAEPQRIELTDGTTIFIPAGAMPVEGEVTLRVDPIARLPHQRHARVVKYGYAIHATDADGRPIEESFNHNVLIQFPFDRDGLRLDAHGLKPAYFSTTTNRWTAPERYAIDLDEGVVKMAIDHFTDFAILEGDIQTIFLPMIGR